MRKLTDSITLAVKRVQQPDDLTCGPACLAQIYEYYGRSTPVAEVIEQTRRNPDGGTLAVYLGASALRDGFDAHIYSYNLRVFDPTWAELDGEAMIAKLKRRERAVRSRRLKRIVAAYIDFLRPGGTVSFPELREKLLAGILRRGHPILTGLSATFLYGTPREREDEYDDIRGEPVGHFVVVTGYQPKSGRFIISDPSPHAPFSRSGRYGVRADKLIASILLGDVTDDAVLLVVKPRSRKR